MSKRVITIGRQFGSDGRIIGNALAAKLGINCYDKELIKLASEQIDIPYEQLKRVDEKREKPWSYQVDLDSGLDRRYRYEHIDEKLFETQSDVILKLAEREDCIIVGRCADYVLRERKDLLSVFIHAPVAFRADRAQKVYEKEAGNMEDFVRKKDKKRAAFYNYFSQNKWGDARHYHLAISSVYGVDFAVEVLKHAAESFPGGTEK